MDQPHDELGARSSGWRILFPDVPKSDSLVQNLA
jgi:hypothetical protein